MKTVTPLPDTQQMAILDAATTEFAEHGFAGARVEAIAKGAGMNKAMLYYRLGDKARLYELVILRQFERLATAVERVDSLDGSALEKLQGILRAVALLFTQDPRLPRIMAWELASEGKSLPEQVLSKWSRIIGSVTSLAGQCGLDPALTHFSLVGPLVFTCLTEPVRKRFAPAIPAHMKRIAGITVLDMADYLGELLKKAARENA
ncbi:MAG: TetR/AcrR family transcriptional regulator [Desulfovibrio sp.]|nr:TetR/AcrR family transcriptional regulator [Desulfovibrio sp.]MBI4960915.1 TetR/AcrR family transcriptional regulator [Desulfovibrio sp.]